MLRRRKLLLMTNRFSSRLAAEGLGLRRGRPEILQVNVGKLCNLTCMHCHVNAGPKRKEIMSRGTIDRIIDWLAKAEIPIVDLTGGAPEMIPDFRYFIEHVKSCIGTASAHHRPLQPHDFARARLRGPRCVSRAQ